MSLGGTNTAVVGVNLADTELTRITTLASGTVTIGDSNQTGNITFTTATPATTAGATTVAVQSTSGGGQIILDDGSGASPALNGNTANVTLTAGTGGVVEAGTNTAGTPDIGSAATTSITSAGAVGTSSSLPIQLVATNLDTNTAANNSNQFLKGTGAITIDATGLNAGTGTVELDGGTFADTSTITGNVTVNNNSTLTGTGSVTGTATVNTGGTINPGTVGTVGSLSVGGLTFHGGNYAADFNGNTSDTITTAGSINLNSGTAGTFTVNSASGTPTIGNVFTLINNTGSGAIVNPPRLFRGADAGGNRYCRHHIDDCYHSRGKRP